MQCLIGGIRCHGVVPLLDLGAGDVGLVLSYAISIAGMFQWGVRQTAEVENLVSLWLGSQIRVRDCHTQSWNTIVNCKTGFKHCVERSL